MRQVLASRSLQCNSEASVTAHCKSGIVSTSTPRQLDTVPCTPGNKPRRPSSRDPWTPSPGDSSSGTILQHVRRRPKCAAGRWWRLETIVDQWTTLPSRYALPCCWMAGVRTPDRGVPALAWPSFSPLVQTYLPSLGRTSNFAPPCSSAPAIVSLARPAQPDGS